MLSLEYIAGLIDADGSISISVSKNRYTNKRGESAPQFSFVVNLRLLQEFRPLLEEVQATLEAGKIYDHKAYSPTSTAMSSWQTTTHDDTMAVCEKLLPLLRIKKKEARLMIQALTAWQAFGTKNRTVDIKDFVLDIASRMNDHQQKASSNRNKEIRKITRCTVPPEGWYCSREVGHEGPCAAWPWFDYPYIDEILS